jgi:4-hydroxy-4-methyl-2-oxoglutarate aldolase
LGVDPIAKRPSHIFYLNVTAKLKGLGINMNKSNIMTACREELFTAVLSDSLDTLGSRQQVATPGILPLKNGMRIAGFARTGIYMPIYHDDEDVNVYEHEIRLIDSLEKDDVPILSCNANTQIAPWGELLSTRAQYLKAAGCIIDGCVRDAKTICEIGFPVFSRGTNPVDTKYRGKMMWMDVPAVVGGANVNSGDLVVADFDGIVFVPAHLIDEVIALSLAKVHEENTIREELKNGSSLRDIFAAHGIL